MSACALAETRQAMIIHATAACAILGADAAERFGSAIIAGLRVSTTRSRLSPEHELGIIAVLLTLIARVSLISVREIDLCEPAATGGDDMMTPLRWRWGVRGGAC